MRGGRRKDAKREEADEWMQRERRETKGYKENECANVFGFLDFKFQIVITFHAELKNY